MSRCCFTSVGQCSLLATMKVLTALEKVKGDSLEFFTDVSSQEFDIIKRFGS